jgi:hypothetical protein
MSTRTLPHRARRAVLAMAAGALLAAMSPRATPAQHPAASVADGTAHAGSSAENKERGVPAPHLKIAPAKERSIVHGGPNVVDHNAIGMPVARPDFGQRPVGLGGRAGAPVPPAPAIPPGAAAGLGSKALTPPRIPTPALRPPVVGRSTISGNAFARPATALKPIGGPAKSASIGINGTNFRAKP